MRIAFTGLALVPYEKLASNEANAKRLGFPRKGRAETARLAVVGGSPSVADHVETLRTWDGTIWAINGAFHWLRSFGIDPVFFSIDPLPTVAKLAEGTKRAVLAMHCDPSVFKALRYADLSVYEMGEHATPQGPTSAASAPTIAAEEGYQEVTFFGCESCYGKTSHIYKHVQPQELMTVFADGQEFMTCPGAFMQADLMSQVIRAAPDFLKEESGGLLRAMVKDPNWDVTGVSRSLYEKLKAA